MEKSAPTKEALDAMRLAGWTREEMCEFLDVSLGTLKRLIKTLGVVSRPTQEKRVSKREKAKYEPIDAGISLMDRCKQVLGPRMGEDYRGYLLDGRPCSSTQVIKAAGFGGNLG